MGYSAGSAPGAAIHPLARELALGMGYPEEKLRSKSWDEFALPQAPHMDFIITVCDDVAGEECPVWLGKPVTAHWGFTDPTKVQGTDDEKKKAFMEVMNGLHKRIQLLADLPFETLDRMSLQARVRTLSKG